MTTKTEVQTEPEQQQALLTRLYEQEAQLASFRALVFQGTSHRDRWVVDGAEAKRLLIVGAGKALLEDYLKTKAVLGALLMEREKNAPSTEKTENTITC